MTTVQLGDTFIADNAATTPVTFPIPAGGRLLHVSVSVGTTGGPVFVAASLKSGAHGNQLIHGWLRSSNISEAFHGLSWDGDLGIPEPFPHIVVRVRNDSGAGANVSANILAERPPREEESPDDDREL